MWYVIVGSCSENDAASKHKESLNMKNHVEFICIKHCHYFISDESRHLLDVSKIIYIFVHWPDLPNPHRPPIGPFQDRSVGFWKHGFFSVVNLIHDIYIVSIKLSCK